MNQATLVALYDAHSELERLSDGALPAAARTFAHECAKHGLGVVARPATAVVMQALQAGAGAHSAPAIALSPAATADEHAHGFRMPHLSVPTIYTGRGAIGADSMAMHSGAAIAIFGAEPKALEHILIQAGKTSHPIAILTREAARPLSDRIHAAYPNLTGRVLISAHPEELAEKLASELRKKSFGY